VWTFPPFQNQNLLLDERHAASLSGEVVEIWVVSVPLQVGRDASQSQAQGRETRHVRQFWGWMGGVCFGESGQMEGETPKAKT
jgi:hypothetical protein